jgi:hypothetical protein
MNVTEVLDIETTEGNSNSTALKAGDKITVQGFSTKYVEGVGSDIAEIETTEGLRHSFGKTVIGQAKSEYWNDVVAKCLDKDSEDGLDIWVVERTAEGTGRAMLALSMFPPKQ